MQIAINLSRHPSDQRVLKPLYVQTQNWREPSDGQLLRRVLPLSTVLTVEFLIRSQLLRSCKQVQTTQKRRYSATFTWFNRLLANIHRTITVGIQIQRDVNIRIACRRSISAGHTRNIGSQQSRENTMSNATAVSTFCQRLKGFS